MNQNQIDGARFVKTGKRGQYTVEFTSTADGCVHQMHDVDNLDQAKALVRERIPGRCVLVCIIDAKDGECITTCNVGRNAAKPKAVAAPAEVAAAATPEAAAAQAEVDLAQQEQEQPAAPLTAAQEQKCLAFTDSDATDDGQPAAIPVAPTAAPTKRLTKKQRQQAQQAADVQAHLDAALKQQADDAAGEQSVCPTCMVPAEQPAKPVVCTNGMDIGSDATPEDNGQAVRLVQAGANDWFRGSMHGWCKLTKRDVAVLRDLFILGATARWCFTDLMDIGTIGGTYKDLNATLDRLATDVGMLALKGETATRAAMLVPTEDVVAAFLQAYDAHQAAAPAAPAATTKRTKQAQPALDYVAGTVLEKTWKGVQYFCTVKGDGTYEVTDAAGTTNGCARTSLSGAARAVTGGSVNGKTFWKPAQPVTTGQVG